MMRRRALVLGWWLCCALGPALSGIAADSGSTRKETTPGASAPPVSPAQRSALAGVPELEKPVTYAEEKIPLGELVQKVAEDTGVTLTAHKDVADEPVAVFVKEFPARALLEQLADLLDYRWSRRSGASGQSDSPEGPTPKAQGPRPIFEIWQDLASKQREEGLRQGILQDAVRRVRAELARYVAVAALPDEQFRALALAAEQRENETLGVSPTGRNPQVPSPEQEARERAARRLRSPITRSLASLLGRLSPQQWSAVSSNGVLTLSTDPRPGEERLPAEMARAFRSARPTVYAPLPSAPDVPTLDPEVEEFLRQQERLVQERWAAATGFRVQIRLQASSGIGGSVTLGASVGPLRSGPADPATAYNGTETDLMIVALPAAAAGGADADTAREIAKAESDPVLGKKATFDPKAPAHPAPYAPTAFPQWRLFDLMPDLARVYGVQFIADAYWGGTPPMPGSIVDRTPRTLYAQLVHYGAGRQIERRGNLVRLRSQTWFFERPREIPLRLVRHWTEVCRDQGAMPLDEYLSIATTLTDDQLKAMPRVVGEASLPPKVADVNSARHALRLVASLAPAQREALWQGQALPVARMGAAQQHLFLAALKEIDRHTRGSLNLAQWSGGTLSVSFGDRSERAVDPRKADLASRSTPAAVSSTLRSGAGIRPTATAGASVAVSPPTPLLTGETGGRRPVMEVRFHLLYAPDTAETVTLTVAPSP